jgi:hypothetical protein
LRVLPAAQFPPICYCCHRGLRWLIFTLNGEWVVGIVRLFNTHKNSIESYKEAILRDHGMKAGVGSMLADVVANVSRRRMKVGSISSARQGVRFLAIVVGLLTVYIPISGCSGEGAQSPRRVVIELFGAMERNERPVLANVLDLHALMELRQFDYALNLDTPRVFTSPTEIFDDLTNDGLTKLTWFKFQRVVGDEEVVGDTAYVDVSFVDRDTGKQTFNKFGVRKIGQRWRIFSFRTLVASE